MKDFEYTDSNGDKIKCIAVGSQVLFTTYGGGGGMNQVLVGQAEAVKLSRALLIFFGAPLEEPKPEPKVGQVWKSEWSGTKIIIVRDEDDKFFLAYDNGTWSYMSAKDIQKEFTFVSESWAEEKEK